MANKELGRKLGELRKSKGYTQQNVSDMLGLKNKSTLGSWESGKSEPDAVTFLKLCSLYEIKDITKTFINKPASEFPLSSSEQSHIEKYRSLDKRGKDTVDNVLEYEHAQSQLRKKAHDTKEKHMEEYAEENVIKFPMKKIKKVTQRAAAGYGTYLFDDEDTEEIELPENDIPSGATLVVEIFGDSMEPTIHDGQYVYVNQNMKPGKGQTGIFVYDNEMFCKRVEFDGDYSNLRLISDNPEYPPKDIHNPEDLHVVGLIVEKRY